MSKSHIQRPFWLPSVWQDNLQGLKNSHLDATVKAWKFSVKQKSYHAVLVINGATTKYVVLTILIDYVP